MKKRSRTKMVMNLEKSDESQNNKRVGNQTNHASREIDIFLSEK